jgi:hypothetical protein
MIGLQQTSDWTEKFASQPTMDDEGCNPTRRVASGMDARLAPKGIQIVPLLYQVLPFPYR